jgi:hypothetical protein
MSGYGDTAARAAAERNKNKSAEPPKPPKSFTPKSTAGAYAMGSPGAPAKPYKKPEPKPPKKKDDSPKGTQGAYTMGTSGGPRVSTPPKAQESAQRRASGGPGGYAEKMMNEGTKMAMRADRIKSGRFKGKYYGPDEFKGNLKLLKAWRISGSPKDTKAFAKSQKG